MADSRAAPCACSKTLGMLLSVLPALAGCRADPAEQSYHPLSEAAQTPRAPQPIAAETDSAPSQPAAARPDAELVAGTFLLQDDALRGLERAGLIELRPVGSSSIVFRATLDAPFRAAFKAPTTLRPAAALNEILAYRLARCLGVSNVPPALLRRVSKAELRRRLEPAFASHWSELSTRLVADRAGYVEGALIYWIEELRELGLESPRVTAEFLEWLQIDAAPPPDKQSIAMQLSTLLAFDYLIGNWDRWSGGNLKGDVTGQVVYMRDNDAAFASRIGEPLLRRMLEPVLQTQRYSRGFVTALRRLSRESLAHELARDSALSDQAAMPEPAESPLRAASAARGRSAHALIDTPAFELVFDRRDTLLSHVAALIEEYGEARVLSFP